jgi:molybdate transport system substrate-binding protein
VQSPTGDMLVNQMRTGSLDAAVAYISNAAGHADDLEAVAIDIPCAFADQPFAIAKGSDFKQLAGRLLRAVLADESRERFRAFGFQWKQKP